MVGAPYYTMVHTITVLSAWCKANKNDQLQCDLMLKYQSKHIEIESYDK